MKNKYFLVSFSIILIAIIIVTFSLGGLFFNAKVTGQATRITNGISISDRSISSQNEIITDNENVELLGGISNFFLNTCYGLVMVLSVIALIFYISRRFK
ncbi:MAG: hypothetical protein WC781_05250 [Candidatus Pacearchaeota archaeon]|jgi:hypothetical protein